MALLPTQKRITTDEAKDPSRVVIFINALADAVYTALSGNLTFGENIASQSKDVTFETTDTYSAGEFPTVNFPKSLKTRARGVIIMQIYENGVPNYKPIRNGVYVDWMENGADIVIGYVTGLEDSTSYTMKLLVI